MLPAARHYAIVEMVNDAQTMSTDELVRRLGVSAETVRRDLTLLEDRGVLHRVHGGAAAAVKRATGEEASFAERSTICQPAKVKLARIAASLMQSGDTVVIDIGTTAVEVARAIPLTFRGTIVTPSLLVAMELTNHPNIEVLISGGRMRRGDLACTNAHAKALFTDIYADLAFIGSGGVDAVVGLTDYHLDEIDVRRTIIANSAHSYILADSSKLDHIAPYRVCELDSVDGLITEVNTSPAIARTIQDAGGVVLSGEIPTP